MSKNQKREPDQFHCEGTNDFEKEELIEGVIVYASKPGNSSSEKTLKISGKVNTVHVGEIKTLRLDQTLDYPNMPGGQSTYLNLDNPQILSYDLSSKEVKAEEEK